jgi:MoxR-like ATPase
VAHADAPADPQVEADPRPAGSGPGSLGSVPSGFRAILENVEQVIRGKSEAIHLALVCLLAEGHLLIEDVPGVGKTSLAKAIARSTGGTWDRIQFTPDLLPSDVTGVSVWNRAHDEFEFRPGGIFANVVLADEINRASPKTQSALLEAMEEQQVTVDGTTYLLAAPFMVIATQNPIELEGTYPLPEAQLDRFLMRITMGYPAREAELAILEQQTGHVAVDELRPVVDTRTMVAMSEAVTRVHVAPHLRTYVVELADATRRHHDLALGTSPRGALALQRAARAYAASVGRDYVMPDDVKRLAPAVLEHRLLLTPDAELRGLAAADVLASILATVPVPGATGPVDAA